MQNTYRVLFLIRKKLNQNGLCAISVRISVNKEKAEFNSLQYIKPELWSQTGRVIGKTKESQQINEALDKIKIALDKHYKVLLEKDGYVTADKLRDTYLGKEIRENSILALYDMKIEQKRSLVGKTIKSTTLSKYLATQKRVTEFIKYKYKKDDLQIRDVDFQFITDYQVYLRSVVNCGHNSTVKHMRYLKQILTIALKNRYISHDPFDDLSLSYKPVQKQFLIEPEIKKLLAKDFDCERLEEVRDIFAFQCFTGVAYVDAMNLTKDNIFEDGFGQKWLKLYRQKSEVAANIPLLEVPLTILKKYRRIGTDNLLPNLSNQKMNAYLKETTAV